jgi:hypothetical protein
MESNKHVGKKVLMVLASLAMGYFILFVQVGGDILYKVQWENLTLAKLGVSILTALAYPIIGAFMVRFCELLRGWGTKGEYSIWDSGERLFFGAIWPLTLTLSLIVYPFLGIINRLF